MTDKDKVKAVGAGGATIEQRLSWIQHELHAPKGNMNEFGGFKYRSLMDIFQALKPLLKMYGGFVRCTDKVVFIGNRYYVEALACYHYEDKFIHATGLAREVETKTKMDPCQITGTASSYARKYAMDGLFAIDNNKDVDSMNPDDHKPAINNEAPKKTPPKKTPPKNEEKVSDNFLDLVGQARRLAGQLGAEAGAIKNEINPNIDKCSEMNEDELTRLVKALQDRINDYKSSEEETASEEVSQEPDTDPDMGM